MCKKINEDAIAVKRLIASGEMKYAEIARLLKISRQKVYYWAHKDIITKQQRRKKFSKFYFDKIIKLARNKTTSNMSCRKISRIINTALIKRNIKYKGKQLKISFKTVSNYLREIYGRPKKIRKVFYLSEAQKKRVVFCQKILHRGIDYKYLMFADECRFDLGAYTRDWIRLDSDFTQKLKNGNPEAYDLINRSIKKFEPSIMVAGGISYFGLTNIIFVEGTMNDFAYGQALLFYKEDIEKINRENNITLILEQDGASCHKSKSNTILLNQHFGKNGWIQNPPNSPDLAYPIEDLWGIIKPRVKRRDPQTLSELKTYIIQEWNSVPLSLIRNLCSGFIKRVKKVIDLNGSRLEPEHLKGKAKEEIYLWNIPEVLPPFRFVYNDKEIFLLRKKEVRQLKRAKKSLKSSFNEDIRGKKSTKKRFKKRDLKYMPLGIGLSITEGPERAKDERDKIIKKIDDKIDSLLKMSLVQYLNYLRSKDTKEKEEISDENSLSTISEEIEERLEKFKEIIKKNKKIKYKLKLGF